MRGTSNKATEMTNQELSEMNNFKNLHNTNLSSFGKVWVFLKKYGVIRGEITRFPLDGCQDRTEIKLENGKYIYVNRLDYHNHIKERGKING